MAVDLVLYSISTFNAVMLIIVAYMGYRISSKSFDEKTRQDEIVEVVRREIISGELSKVLDLKLAPVLQKLDDLDRKVDRQKQ
ncbi:MAG: hypothetical protein QXO47_10070 [Thermoproteota archaeon]